MPKPNVREQLLQAGLATLYSRGFNATSVQDITEAAGVPKGSFYNHFDSKEALGAEVVAAYTVLGSDKRAKLRDGKGAPLTRLREYFKALNQMAVGSEFTHGCLLGNFGAELADQSVLIRQRVGEAFDDWCAVVAEVIAQAQEEGAVGKEIAAADLAAFLINAWEGALIRAKVQKRREPLDVFTDVTFSRLLV